MFRWFLCLDNAVYPHWLGTFNGLDGRHQYPHALQTQIVTFKPVIALKIGIIDKISSLRLGGEVQCDALVHVAVEDDLALVQHDAAVTQVADRRHVVADVEHGLAVAPGGLAHLGQALLLELHVADGEDLVHDHDLAVQMGGHGACR